MCLFSHLCCYYYLGTILLFFNKDYFLDRKFHYSDHCMNLYSSIAATNIYFLQTHSSYISNPKHF